MLRVKTISCKTSNQETTYYWVNKKFLAKQVTWQSETRKINIVHFPGNETIPTFQVNLRTLLHTDHWLQVRLPRYVVYINCTTIEFPSNLTKILHLSVAQAFLSAIDGIPAREMSQIGAGSSALSRPHNPNASIGHHPSFQRLPCHNRSHPVQLSRPAKLSWFRFLPHVWWHMWAKCIVPQFYSPDIRFQHQLQRPSPGIVG